jgi:hypothetical protein
MKYLQKAVLVSAFQMTKERRTTNLEWPNWLHEAWAKPVVENGSLFCSRDYGVMEREILTPLYIQTPQGTKRVEWGDWIILGDEGDLRLMNHDDFMEMHGRMAVGYLGAEEIKKNYNELIMAVSHKYPGESRHETALRYIRSFESYSEEAARAKTEEPAAGQGQKRP